MENSIELTEEQSYYVTNNTLKNAITILTDEYEYLENDNIIPELLIALKYFSESSEYEDFVNSISNTKFYNKNNDRIALD